MKKIFNILAAALMSAAVLTSCAEKEIVTYYPDEVVIPALQELSVEEGLQLSDGDGVIFATLQFSAADFGIATAARYTAYADIKKDFSSKQALANVTTDTAGIAISAATLNNALITLGCPDSVDVKVYFRIETQMMGESSPVERVEALVSNAVSAVVKPYDAEKIYPSIYVIGQFCEWNHGNTALLFSYAEDEENYVGVVDFGAECADYGFKLTGEPNWDDNKLNWGVTKDENANPTPEPATLQLVNNEYEGGSQNILNYSSFRYYNFHFVKTPLTLNMVKGFNSVKVAGDFNGWAADDTNTDEMTQIRSNGKFYIDLEITAAGGFKFILDNGGTWIGTGEGEGKVNIGGGDNIQIAEPGNYRFYLDLNDWDNPTYSLSASDYGTPVDDGGSDTPDEPEDPEDPENPEDPDQPEVKENLWGVIGSFAASAWGADIYMTEFPAGSGIWISTPIAFAAGDEFKLRFNNEYNQQVSPAAAGDSLRTGIPYVDCQSNSNNFKIAESQAGNRVIVYNANDNTVYFLGWSVIGAISGDSWGHDFPMIFDPEANTWSVSGLSVEGAFKLRWAGQWSAGEVTIPDRGLADGASFAVGTPINLKQGGGDINPGESVGTYNMVYDVANETLTLTAAE